MTFILAAALLQANPIVCPIMGVEPVAAGGRYDYAGIRIGFCCVGCRNSFESDPEGVVEAGRKSGKVFGEFQFDPVSRLRWDPKKPPTLTADHQGIRYRFLSSEARAAFLQAKEKLAKTPVKEALYCIEKSAPAKAPWKAFADQADTRYFLDCDTCVKAFATSPAGFVESAAKWKRNVEPVEVLKDES